MIKAFALRTIANFSSTFTRRASPDVPDVENNHRAFPRWFVGKGVNRSPTSSKLLGAIEDEKIHQEKSKKLGSFSGVRSAFELGLKTMTFTEMLMGLFRCLCRLR
jgi:hypothetical protein